MRANGFQRLPSSWCLLSVPTFFMSWTVTNHSQFLRRDLTARGYQNDAEDEKGTSGPADSEVVLSGVKVHTLFFQRFLTF